MTSTAPGGADRSGQPLIAFTIPSSSLDEVELLVNDEAFDDDERDHYFEVMSRSKKVVKGKGHRYIFNVTVPDARFLQELLRAPYSEVCEEADVIIDDAIAEACWDYGEGEA